MNYPVACSKPSTSIHIRTCSSGPFHLGWGGSKLFIHRALVQLLSPSFSTDTKRWMGQSIPRKINTLLYRWCHAKAQDPVADIAVAVPASEVDSSTDEERPSKLSVTMWRQGLTEGLPPTWSCPGSLLWVDYPLSLQNQFGFTTLKVFL